MLGKVIVETTANDFHAVRRVSCVQFQFGLSTAGLAFSRLRFTALANDFGSLCRDALQAFQVNSGMELQTIRCPRCYGNFPGALKGARHRRCCILVDPTESAAWRDSPVPEKRAIHILLVEDCPTDALLFRRAVRRIDPEAKVFVATAATSASLYLKQDGQYPDAPRPNIIVCDSILHSESGLDLLEWVRAHPLFQTLPFVVLSGNADRQFQKKLVSLGATAFFQKPADTQAFREVVRQILLHVAP